MCRWACQILGRDRWEIWAKKEKYLIFPGLSKGIWPNGMLLITYLRAEDSLSYKIFGENLKLKHFETIFQLIPQLCPSPSTTF